MPTDYKTQSLPDGEVTSPLDTDIAMITRDPTGSPVDYYIKLRNLINGWMGVSATWTYASANTITVPSGAAAIYSVGDKWRLTANAVVLQGYIIGVADTVLTTVGNALTNHVFSAISFSKAVSPVGFPQTFNFDGASGLNPQGFSGTPTGTFKFSIIGRLVQVRVFVTGTSNATTLTFTLPVACSSNVYSFCRALDNTSTYITGLIVIGSSTATCYTSVTANPWTNSGTKSIENAIFNYFI